MRAWMLLAFLCFGLSTVAIAGAKDDFIKAVKTQCGKSDTDAAVLATPGRTGNVIKLKTCTSDSVTVGYQVNQIDYFSEGSIGKRAEVDMTNSSIYTAFVADF